MNLKRTRNLCMESYAAPWNFNANYSLYYRFMTAVNNADPEFMKDLFRLCVTTRFFYKQRFFFLTQPQCCLTFS